MNTKLLSTIFRLPKMTENENNNSINVFVHRADHTQKRKLHTLLDDAKRPLNSLHVIRCVTRFLDQHHFQQLYGM